MCTGSSARCAVVFEESERSRLQPSAGDDPSTHLPTPQEVYTLSGQSDILLLYMQFSLQSNYLPVHVYWDEDGGPIKRPNRAVTGVQLCCAVSVIVLNDTLDNFLARSNWGQVIQ